MGSYEMQDYEGLLHEATAEEVLAQLAGEQGLIAVTRGEILYINPQGVLRAPLYQAKRVVSAKKLYGGRADILVVASEQGPLFEVPAKGFDPKELQEFFGSVKTYVARARRQATYSEIDTQPPSVYEEPAISLVAESLPPPTEAVPGAPTPPPIAEPAPEPPPAPVRIQEERRISRTASPPRPQSGGNTLFQILGIVVILAGILLAWFEIPSPEQRFLVGGAGVVIGGVLVWLGRRS